MLLIYTARSKDVT